MPRCRALAALGATAGATAPIPHARRWSVPPCPQEAYPGNASCAIQLAMLCAVGPNSRNNSSGARPTRASSTICWRNSAGYGRLDLGTSDASFLNTMVSAKVGQLHSTSAKSAVGGSVGASDFARVLRSVQTVRVSALRSRNCMIIAAAGGDGGLTRLQLSPGLRL